MPPSSLARAGRSRSLGGTHPNSSRHLGSRGGTLILRTPPVRLTTTHSDSGRSVIGYALPHHGSPRPLSSLLNQSQSASNSNPAAAGGSSSMTPPGITANMHPAAAVVAAADAHNALSSGRSRSPPRPLPYGLPRSIPVHPVNHNISTSAAAVAVAPVAAAPHPYTSAPLYEAFEPGDSGFFAPTSAEIVTSSSGSVMVKVCAHFSGAEGDRVLVCGGTRSLGNWEPDAAPALTWGDGDEWTATLELPAGTHEFKCVAIRKVGVPVWEPGNNRRVVVPRPGPLSSSSVSGDDLDLVLGLIDGGDEDDDQQPDAQLVETSGGNTMVKLTTTYTAAFGEYLKVVGGPVELGAWDAGAAPALTWGDGDVWTATLELPAGTHEFKYVVVRKDGRLEWEPGENRRIHVPLPGLAAALAAAKKVAAAEEAAAGGGSRRPAAAARKLSAAEVYQRQEAEQQLEPWQEGLPQYSKQQQQGGVPDVPAAVSNGHPSPVVSAGWREVKFSTQYAAEFGTFLKVVGGPDQLGAWDVTAAPPLQWSEGDVWSNTLLLPPGTHEFKLVVVLANGEYEWEAGPNRLFEVQPAATAADEAAGVMQAECLYGATQATGSIWASLEDEEEDEEAAAAAAAAAAVLELHRQQQQLSAAQSTDWVPQQQSLADAMSLAAPVDSSVDEEEVEQAAAAVPLPPLDAVVKVFRDRFAAQSSVDEDDQPQAATAAEQQQEQEEELAASPTDSQEEQQLQPSVGDRFAAIIAARKQQQQQPPAILFVDKQEQQQQQPGTKPQPANDISRGNSSDGSTKSGNWIDAMFASSRQRQQQQQRQQSGPTPPWELQPDDQGEGDLDRSSSTEQQQQQQQQQPERFASQIDQIRSRPPPSAARSSGQQQQQQQRYSVRPPWEVDADGSGSSSSDADESDVQPPQSSERFASQIQHIRSRSPTFSRQQQQQQQSRVDERKSEHHSRENTQPVSSSGRTSWRSDAQEQQQQQPPPDSNSTESSSSSGGRFAAYFAQQDVKPSAASSSSSSSSEGRPGSPSWRSTSPVQSTDTDTAATTTTTSSSDRWSGYSWRTPSPDSETDHNTTAASSSREASVTTSGGRFSKYTSGNSWRSSSPSPAQQQQVEQSADKQQLQQSSEQRDADQSSSGGRFANYVSSSRDTASSSSSSSSSRCGSSWSAVDASGVGGDYLYALGQSDYNTNVDAGQNVAMIDSLFTGNVLGHKTDIADGSLRGWEVRTLNNIIGDYYIAPRFMDKVAMHITKNYLSDVGAMSKTAKVPLILGIWGPKGCGKTFQTELAFKQLGVEPVVMSAGELESETAGQPGRLIRERYRKAAELSKTRGKLSCLVINDLDAGIGRFGNTQVTVNNQIVIGTLMNICDNPNRVSVGAGWREDDEIRRVPIIVTGNDFSTLYAPLIRDGRMEKFYWQPEREDLVNIVHQMYKEDGVSRRDIEVLIDTFSHQALDFFGALRAATYDGQIREWMAEVAGAPLYAADETRVRELNRRLLTQTGVPEFEPVPLTLDLLLAEGRRLVAEQQAVNSSRLGEAYMKGVVWGEEGADAWSSAEVDE